MRGGPHAEGVNVGAKERELRLDQRVDRSHRRVVRRCPRWTKVEKAVFVLGVILLLAEVVLAALLFVL